MGQLIDGVWHDTWYDTKSTGGRFKRTEAVWRNWVTADGSAGPTGNAGFAAERERYHLYVSSDAPAQRAGGYDFGLGGASIDAGKRLDL